MRDPFELPESCDEVVFDINIVPADLPVCSLPSFTSATMLSPSVFFSMPLAPPPWNCYTIPEYFATGRADPKIGVGEMRISVKVFPLTVDACSPSFGISIDTSLPCLPLSVDTSFGIEMFGGEPACDPLYIPPLPSGQLYAGMKDPCALSMSLELGIPCIGFTPQINASIRGDYERVDPSMLFRAYVEDGCVLDFNLGVKIPLYSCPVVNNFSVGVFESDTDTAYGVGTGYFNEDCELRLDLDLYLPAVSCPEVNKFSVGFHESDTGEAYGVGNGEFNEDCELVLGLDLYLPAVSCPTVNKFSVGVHESDTGEAYGVGNGVFNESCELELGLDLYLPAVSCPTVNKFSVGFHESDTGEAYGVGNGVFNESCELELGLDLYLPAVSCPTVNKFSVGVHESDTGEAYGVGNGVFNANCELELGLDLYLLTTAFPSFRFVRNVVWRDGGLWQQPASITSEGAYIEHTDELVVQGVSCPN